VSDFGAPPFVFGVVSVGVEAVVSFGAAVSFGGAGVSVGPQPAADRANSANTTAIENRHLVKTLRVRFIVIDLSLPPVLSKRVTRVVMARSSVNRARIDELFQAPTATEFAILGANREA
jgi:hypothetical protein